jgi:dihydrofolate reductase
MSKVIFVMAMSLDGFVNDRHGPVDPLYPDFTSLDDIDLMKEMVSETGAVLMARRMFEMAGDPDWYAGNYEFQQPIFVVTNRVPDKHPKQTGALTFTFVTAGLQDALTKARNAAGDKQVTVVGGPNLAHQLLRMELLDELQIGIMPILLGKGLRLFEHLEDIEIRFEKIRTKETGPRTDIWFKPLR